SMARAGSRVKHRVGNVPSALRIGVALLVLVSSASAKDELCSLRRPVCVSVSSRGEQMAARESLRLLENWWDYGPNGVLPMRAIGDRRLHVVLSDGTTRDEVRATRVYDSGGYRSCDVELTFDPSNGDFEGRLAALFSEAMHRMRNPGASDASLRAASVVLSEELTVRRLPREVAGHDPARSPLVHGPATGQRSVPHDDAKFYRPIWDWYRHEIAKHPMPLAALFSMSGSTLPGGEPDVWDVLKASHRGDYGQGSGWDELYLRYALARASEKSAPVRWSVEWPKNARKLTTFEGLDPLGWVAIDVATAQRKKDAGLRIEIDWEESANMRWGLVKLDGAGRSIGTNVMPVVPRSAQAAWSFAELGDAATLRIVGTFTSEWAVPIDEEESWTPRGWVVSIVEE
nr:hypothetical protein [Polyangiaceae bacterium]